MSSYSQRAAFRAAGWVALAALIALSLLALCAIAVPVHAHAADGGPKIVFTSPIYAGQNNDNAEGPVGTRVNLQGSGWTPGGDGVTVTLADEQNDSPGQPGSACQNGSPQIGIGILYSPIAADNEGKFREFFPLPAEAGAKGHSYWACGKQGSTTSVGVSKFTVLSSDRPSVQINFSQAAPGSTIPVTGKNWLPGGIQITIIVAPCVACDPPFSSRAQATSNPDGTFSAQAQVPPVAQDGTLLYVSALSADPNNRANNGALSTGESKDASFRVVGQPAPTPTPTAAPTLTATSSPTATGTVTATSTSAATGGGSGGNTSDSSGNGVLIVLLAALGAVLLIAAVVAVLLFMRSRSPAPKAPGVGSAPYGGSGPYAPSGGQYGGPRRARGSGPPSYPETNLEYYNDDYYAGPPRSGPASQRWGNAGGWQGGQQGRALDDGSGDEPTICMQNPWR